MKMTILRLLLAAAVLAAVSTRAADKAVRYEGQPGGKIKIDGTSSVHDWTVETQIIGGFLEVDAAFDADFKAFKKPKVEVSIPIRSLKSGKKPMDTVMQETMKMGEHPKIEYRLIDMSPRPGAEAAKAQFEARGALTVAGVTRTNTMVVTLQHVDAKTIKVTGTAAVKMTDHGMKPPAPALALGLIKTGDDVKLTIEWLTARVEGEKK
ncbi:MAG: YceI family protein [Verrucomicrobia bacterium]|nr:YceI family protein [Verrucomicrobiota bacterium]